MTAPPETAAPVARSEGEHSAVALAIVGPTASGKSALAMELAALLGDAEIVSVDSMQVYREMDIGTAKPSLADRSSVAHHLIDLVDPSDECSVAWFQRAAFDALAEIGARGRRAILVGGTGLYHRAVIDGLEIPGQFDSIRCDLEREPSTEVLHARLVGLDPVAASRMEPTNRRRIIRALEVSIGSGRPFSSFGPGLEEYPRLGFPIVGLSVERDRIGPLVAQRVRDMVDAGFVGEVEQLANRTPKLSRTARQALGYRELLGAMAGETTIDDAIEQTVVRTRQFAVRQHRWFRRDPRIDWFEHETPSLAHRIADTVVPP